MGAVFQESFDAHKDYCFLDQVREPFRFPLCPSSNQNISKYVRLSSDPDVGFVVDGPPNPPFSLSPSFADILGIPLNTLTFLFMVREAAVMRDWNIRARKKRKDGSLEPIDLDVMTVTVLPNLKFPVDFIFVDNDKETPWDHPSDEDLKKLLKNANDIIEIQTNIRLEEGSITSRSFSQIHAGVLPYLSDEKYTVPPSMRWFRTGITFKDAEIGCYGSSIPRVHLGCDPTESKIVLDPVVKAYIDGTNFKNNLALEFNYGRFQVFVVSSLQKDSGTDKVAAFNILQYRKCVIQKNATPQILAHEIGHWMFRTAYGYVNNHHIQSGYLMFPDVGGARISMEEAYAAHFLISKFLQEKGWY